LPGGVTQDLLGVLPHYTKSNILKSKGLLLFAGRGYPLPVLEPAL